MAIPRRWRTLHVLREHGAELLARVKVQRFGESGVERSGGHDAEDLTRMRPKDLGVSSRPPFSIARL